MKKGLRKFNIFNFEELTLKVFVLCFLVFSFVVQPLAVPADAQDSLPHSENEFNGDAGDPFKANPALQEFLLKIQSGEDFGAPVDNFSLLSQELRVFRTQSDGSQGETARYSLASLDPNKPTIKVADIQNQVKVRYDREARELVFELYEGKGRRLVKAYEHVFLGVDLTTDAENSLVRDENVMLFSTPKGVSGIFWPLAKQALFNAPIPHVSILPPITHIDPEARIKGIEIFNSSDLKPRSFLNMDEPQQQEEADQHKAKIKLGDVLLEIETPDGDFSIRVDYHKQILPALASKLAHLLFQMEVIDPSDFQNESAWHDILSIVQGHQATILEMEATRNDLLESGGDLQKEALLNLVQELNREQLRELLTSNKSDQNAFDRVLGAPQMSMTVEEWVNAHKKQVLGSPADGQFWADKVSDAFEDVEPQLESAVDNVEGLTDRTTGQILGTIRNTPITRLVLMAGALAGLEVATGGQVGSIAYSFFSQLFAFTESLPRVPLLASLGDKLAAKSSFYQSAYSASFVAGALAASIALRPIGIWVAHQVSSKLLRKDFGSVRTFFYWGVKTYAYAAYPIQKLVLWDALFAQRNLYKAMDSGVSPLSSTAPWHVPYSRRSIERSRQRIADVVRDRAERRSRAMILAAALVSQASSDGGEPIDAANLLRIMEAKDAGNVKEVTEFFDSVEDDVEWSRLAARVEKELKRTHDKGLGDLSIELVASYLSSAQSALDNLKAAKSGSSLITDKVHSASKWFKTLTAKNILPFIFFGKQGYDVFRRYKNLLIDERNTDTAAEQFKEDYDLSAVFYAGFDPVIFGQAAHLNAHAMAELGPNQVEQIAIWGMQGPIDAMETYRASVELQDPSAAFWRHRFPFHVPLSKGGLGRANSALVDTAIATKGIFDPNKESTILGTQDNKMRAHIEGLQTRMLQGYVPRVLGFTLLALVSHEAASMFDALAAGWDGGVQAFPAQLNFTFNKYAVMLPSLMIGYAAVWGPVTALTNYVKNRAIQSGNRLTTLFARGDLALRHQLDAETQESVRELQNIYLGSSNADELKAEDINGFLEKPASEFSAKEARNFFQWAMEHVPVATLTDGHSVSFIRWLNRIGVVVSVLLYVGLSNDTNNAVQAGLASGDTSIIWKMAAESTTWFFATWGGVKAAKGFFGKISEWRRGRSHANKCAQAISDLNR